MIQEQIIAKITDLRLTARKHVKIASNCKERKHTPRRNSKVVFTESSSYKGKLNAKNACQFRLMIQATSNGFSHSLRRI